MGQSYLFSDLRVCFFNRKYLNGTRDSKIEVAREPIEAVADIAFAVKRFMPKKNEYDEIKRRILAIEVNKQSVCLNCKSRIGNEEGGDQLAQCPFCNLKMLKVSLVQNVTAYMIIADKNGKNLGRFFCSGETLNQMFTSIAEFF